MWGILEVSYPAVPRPLSVDLRTRIVNACAAQELSQAEIAELFQVHLKTVEKLWKQWRTTQSVAIKPHAGGRATRLAPYAEDLRQWLDEKSDLTQEELIALLRERRHITVSQSMVSRALAQLGLPRKKKSLRASEHNRPDVAQARAVFRARMPRLVAEDLVFVDESGVTTNMTRLYGRAPKGQRVHEAVPHGHWKGMTILGAMSLAGIQAAMTVDAATDADIFATFLERVLAPTLRPGQVVLLDNLSAHKQEQARVLVEARGCQLRYLPPYSPELNPIERAWSKVKSRLRALKARAWEALEQGVQAALAAITAEDSRGYFAHCGYTL
jgi:transposase